MFLRGLDRCIDCHRLMAPGLYACPHCRSNRIETVEEHAAARRESGQRATAAAQAWLKQDLVTAISLGREAIRLNIWNSVAQANLGNFYLTSDSLGDEGGTPLEYVARALSLVHPTPDDVLARVRTKINSTKIESEITQKRPFWCLTAYSPDSDIDELLSAIPDEWGSCLFRERSQRTEQIWANCLPDNAEVFRNLVWQMYPKAVQVEFVSALTKPQVWYLKAILQAWGSHATLTAFPLTQDEEMRLSAWIPSGAGAVVVKNPDTMESGHVDKQT